MAANSNLEKLSGKNVLLTGGCGFIGSEITKQLSEIGSNVTIIDNFSSGKEEYVKKFSNVKIVEGDLQNSQIVADAVKNQDYVIHLAALPFIPDSYHIPMEFFNVNVNATINLVLALIKENSVERFVHISSSEIYGSAQTVPMKENHPTIPHSTYAVSKLAGERVVYTMHKEHNFPAVIIRPFNSCVRHPSYAPINKLGACKRTTGCGVDINNRSNTLTIYPILVGPSLLQLVRDSCICNGRHPRNTGVDLKILRAGVCANNRFNNINSVIIKRVTLCALSKGEILFLNSPQIKTTVLPLDCY